MQRVSALSAVTRATRPVLVRATARTGSRDASARLANAARRHVRASVLDESVIQITALIVGQVTQQ